MDLSNPGADLFGVNEAAALRVLARQVRDRSGREVARLASASPSSIRRALERLERIGLVHSRASSHAVLYRPNRDHVLWEPVLAVLTAPARIEAAVGDLVNMRLGQQATVAIFGSVARRDSTPASDVDVALVFDDAVDSGVREALVDDLADLVESKTGNAVQILELSRTQLRDMVQHRDPLVASWSADALTLAGPSLASLIASA